MNPTAEQAAILAAPLAPLRIAAGAGTGKTTTLAMRIAQLVGQGFEQRAILGLTFTNKAAAELAERAAAHIAQLDPAPDDLLEQVDIRTYHGFAHALLDEFGAYVGVERGAGLITPTFSRQVMADAMAATPVQTLNTTWDGTIDDAVQLASRLTDNLKEPSDLVQTITGAEDVDLQRAEFAAIIETFIRAKARLGVVDYGDLLGKACQLVSTHPELAARIRDRYRAVFLDEYQDTNPAQRILLQTIFGSGFPITAVGDADQTIYEWRGATPANFDHFAAHFPTADGEPAPSLPLSLNRRSGRKIIEFANAIRSHIAAPDSHDLSAIDDAGHGTVNCRWFATAVDEAGFIADEITRLHDEGTAWRDMAVLFRKNRSIELIRKSLEDADIPVEVANVGGLLDIPEIADVVAWLRILEHPADHAAALRILLGSTYRLGLGDIRPLADWVRDANRDQDDVVHTLVEAAEHAADVPRIDERAADALTDFSSRYRRLLEAAQGVNLVELVRLVLAEVGAWPEIEAMSDAARQSARLNMYRFLDLAEEWSPLEGRPSLETFLQYLRIMEAEDAEELSAAHLSGEDAVALLTVHRAKGLEWDAVFVPTVYRGNFPSTSRRFDDPYSAAGILPYELRIEGQPDPTIDPDMKKADRNVILKARHERSEWRLGYVAATRARQHLWLTGAWWYGHPTPTKLSKKKSALYELAEAHPAATDHGTADEPPQPPGLLLPPPSNGGPDPLFGDDGWSAAIRARLADDTWAATQAAELGMTDSYDNATAELQQLLFELPSPSDSTQEPGRPEVSVTDLVTYATCPQRYYWTRVDPLPRRPSRAAALGVAVHRRIELHNRGALPFTDPGFDAYDAVEIDTAAPGETQPDDPYQVYAGSRFAEAMPLFVEHPFDVRVGDATIRGRVDAIYPGWEVVDFKSGRPSANQAAQRQLEAYAIAVADGAFGTPPDRLSVTFAHLGGGELVEITTDANEAWIEQARQTVARVLDDIRTERFDPTPGPACRSCDFARFCDAGTAYLSETDRPPPPG